MQRSFRCLQELPLCEQIQHSCSSNYGSVLRQAPYCRKKSVSPSIAASRRRLACSFFRVDLWAFNTCCFSLQLKAISHAQYINRKPAYAWCCNEVRRLSSRVKERVSAECNCNKRNPTAAYTLGPAVSTSARSTCVYLRYQQVRRGCAQVDTHIADTGHRARTRPVSPAPNRTA